MYSQYPLNYSNGIRTLPLTWQNFFSILQRLIENKQEYISYSKQFNAYVKSIFFHTRMQMLHHPFWEWGSLTMAFTGKFLYIIYIYVCINYIYILHLYPKMYKRCSQKSLAWSTLHRIILFWLFLRILLTLKT